MAEMHYLNFDLLIERQEEKYRARILDSPAGQAAAPFVLPFSKLELENFLLRIGQSRRTVRRGLGLSSTSEQQIVQSFGERLFESVFAGDINAALQRSLDRAEQSGAMLRIRMRLADVPELADLPWEYLYDPTLHRFVSLTTETLLVRYLDVPQRVNPLAVTPPLRILVMISSPKDYPQLDTGQEWTRLKVALRSLESQSLITVERLKSGNLPALQRRLRQGEYHIFHFIGHGGFDSAQDDGVLLLEEGDRSHPVSGGTLGTLLDDHRPLRLAVLNACEGARTSRKDPFAGVAQSLVQRGVPAVIAMQFEITDDAAITFAQEFYAAIADQYPVDAALAEARKAIFVRGNQFEWGTPVLYMRSPDGHIFDVEEVSEEERQNERVVALYTEAKIAVEDEDWGTAADKLLAVRKLEPAHEGAITLLKDVRRQQRLTNLYTAGCAHYDARRYTQSLQRFREILRLAGDYRDTVTWINRVEQKLEQERQSKARKEEVQSPVTSTSEPTLLENSGWYWMATGAVLVLLLFASVIVFAGRFDREGTATAKNDDTRDGTNAAATDNGGEPSNENSETTTSGPAGVSEQQKTPITAPVIVPTATPLLPTATPHLPSPAQAVRDYYAGINNRDYNTTWATLSAQFKDKFNCCKNGQYDFGAYVEWWDSVQRTDVGDVSVIRRDSYSATVHAQLSYLLYGGRRIPDNNPYIEMVFDSDQQRWLFNDKGATP